MSKKLLIDAAHSEETRVAVIEESHLLEFDYENKVRKQLKGSIFLAKVTRVEPSLQAAFVDYGGNRHGFLPFSEIHPDYFKIPVEDKEALQAEMAEEAERQRAREEAEEREAEEREAQQDAQDREDDGDETLETVEIGGIDDVAVDDSEEAEGTAETELLIEDAVPVQEIAQEEDPLEEDGDNIGNLKSGEEDEVDGNIISEDSENSDRGRARGGRGRGRRGRGGRGGRGRGRGGNSRAASSRRVEVTGEYEDEGQDVFRPNLRRKYKIQEVIKRGQIMLIQVSKEERGNKGAAVTTYLSLAGRYCVLMPNSPRAGGVSRKVPLKDRRQMKSILNDLGVGDGMSVILRTAGVDRSKAEIKRDYDYLSRLWENIREETLQSSAPARIYEEAGLIRRSIRDLYTGDINEVLVAGKDGYKEAKDFMKLMIPSHARKVKLYEDEQTPLFHRHRIESQISAIGEVCAPMKSGGYLVINPTEALVSIDVNSGRATKERHIEETALNTNLEAADEVARQLRLRDLGGLVVIDFIDMEDHRNNRKVQNRMREALSKDRARIQVGKISNFGLMELSRQRLNPSLTEAQFQQCPHCQGSGMVRTLESATLSLLRELEEEGIKDRAGQVIVEVSNEIALYILNNKRGELTSIEERYGIQILIQVKTDLADGQYKIDPVKGSDDSKEDGEDRGRGGRGNRNSRRNRDDEEDGGSRGGRRRGRRGGRRNREEREDKEEQTQELETVSSQPVAETPEAETPDSEISQEKPKKRGRPSKKKEDAASADASEINVDSGEDDKKKEPIEKKAAKRASRKKIEKSEANKDDVPVKSHPDEKVTVLPDSSAKGELESVSGGGGDQKAPARKGWWNRLME